MDFRYSELISPDTYKTDGLCHGICLRRHKDPLGEIRGAIRCQRDWSKRIGPVRNYKGTLGTPFSFMRVTVPESLPERLEIISYANEFAFLYDGRLSALPFSLKRSRGSYAIDAVMENLDQDLVSLCASFTMMTMANLTS